MDEDTCISVFTRYKIHLKEMRDSLSAWQPPSYPTHLFSQWVLSLKCQLGCFASAANCGAFPLEELSSNTEAENAMWMRLNPS